MKRILRKILDKLETRIIFYPMRQFFDEKLPELQGVMEDVFFENKDRMSLNAWYAPAKDGKPVILYCHGQAEHIAYLQKPYQVMIDNGYGVFAVEYRGHGKSEGIPSEVGIYQDICDAVEFLKANKGLREEDIVVWGRSMGGAVAADAATKHNFAGAILESTFTTIKEASEYIIKSGCNHPIFGPRRKFLFRLAKFCPMSQQFNTVGKIHKIKSPLLILHSKNDLIVDYRMAQTNAQTHGNARLFMVEEGSHDHSDWAYDEVLDFLAQISVRVG